MRVSDAGAGQLQGDSHVQAVVAYEPYYKMDAALPAGSGGVIAVYDSDGGDAVDKALVNAVRKSVATIDGLSATKLKAGLAEAQAGMGGG